MKRWCRLFTGKSKEDAQPITETMVQPPVSQLEVAEPVRALHEFFCVVEVGEADFLVGSLFRRRFGCDSFPQTPKHFVAFFKQADGSLLTLGYVHFEMWQQQALCGGLVIDERAWRLLPAPERMLLRQQGGVAEMLLRASFDQLPDDLIAIWGYVGDKQAEKVDLRVGFRHTPVEHVMVIWRSDSSDAEKALWLQKVADLGPF